MAVGLTIFALVACKMKIYLEADSKEGFCPKFGKSWTGEKCQLSHSPVDFCHSCSRNFVSNCVTPFPHQHLLPSPRLLCLHFLTDHCTCSCWLWGFLFAGMPPFFPCKSHASFLSPVCMCCMIISFLWLSITGS